MKREVLLEITGSQRIDSQKDQIEMTTVGTMEEQDDAYIVCYTEEQEPPAAPVYAQVRIAKDNSRVEITRSGAGASCLVIEKSRRNLCRYGTPYGDMLMGVFGKCIEADTDGCSGSFRFGYDIDINGALASRNELCMTFRENGAKQELFKDV